jgi:hypothetical protein
LGARSPECGLLTPEYSVPQFRSSAVPQFRSSLFAQNVPNAAYRMDQARLAIGL